MSMSAAHCQGISECLESGHPVISIIIVFTAYIVLLSQILAGFTSSRWLYSCTRMVSIKTYYMT